MQEQKMINPSPKGKEIWCLVTFKLWAKISFNFFPVEPDWNWPIK